MKRACVTTPPTLLPRAGGKYRDTCVAVQITVMEHAFDFHQCAPRRAPLPT